MRLVRSLKLDGFYPARIPTLVFSFAMIDRTTSHKTTCQLLLPLKGHARHPQVPYVKGATSVNGRTYHPPRITRLGTLPASTGMATSVFSLGTDPVR